MIEMEVPAGRYPLRVMSEMIELVLQQMEPAMDWSAWVEQVNDRTLRIRFMSVN